MQLFRSNHNCRAFSDAIVNSLGRVRGPDLPPAERGQQGEGARAGLHAVVLSSQAVFLIGIPFSVYSMPSKELVLWVYTFRHHTTTRESNLKHDEIID